MYGNDIDETTTPVEATLLWTVGMSLSFSRLVRQKNEIAANIDQISTRGDGDSNYFKEANIFVTNYIKRF